MRTGRVDAAIKGWIVGDFEPTLLRTTSCEVAIKHYVAGQREGLHHHRVACELTAVVSGQVQIYGQRLGPDDVIVLEPGEATDFEAITDAVTVVVKLPGAKGDKYEGCADPTLRREPDPVPG